MTYPKIDASPTKEFFISILSRDVNLLDAISDLVDNCVDGARRLRNDGNYRGLNVIVELKEDYFRIKDNCGGIPYETARDYAFKFGRAVGAPSTEGSIGKFGVGMKRSFFKIGTGFTVISTSKNSRFKIDENVEVWKTKKDMDGKDIWEFEFKELEIQADFDEAERKTEITIQPLHPAISEEFKLRNFINRLVDALQSKHEQAMEQGLEIIVNDVQLKHKLAQLLVSDKIKPLRKEIEFHIDPNNPNPNVDVKVSIFAGISDANLDGSGWNVICNGRQVLRADKSGITGWGEVNDGVSTPKSHYQFSRFRGYVFFESNDAGSLPWNTAKSGVDTESRVYQAIKLEMIAAMRQVIDFLNKVDAESDTEETFLQDSIQNTKATKLTAITTSSSFTYPLPSPSRNQGPKMTRVSFQRPIDEVEFAKEYFGVSTAAIAGGEAFSYFLERERD